MLLPLLLFDCRPVGVWKRKERKRKEKKRKEKKRKEKKRKEKKRKEKKRKEKATPFSVNSMRSQVWGLGVAWGEDGLANSCGDSQGTSSTKQPKFKSLLGPWTMDVRLIHLHKHNLWERMWHTW